MLAVVVPSYKVKKHILNVVTGIGKEVDRVYVVDDCCPENTGIFLQANCSDDRVKVIFHEENQGVGGAIISGYKRALQDGANIIVIIAGDDQMDATQLPRLIDPIVKGKADFTKANRFFELEYLAKMPRLRVLGNAVLSFVNKLSSGYWDIMDPSNGFTAIHSSVLEMIPLDKLDKRYFYESDMLFRLNIARAVVWDIPMRAIYKDEKSSMKISRIVFEFPKKYALRFTKRIFYTYFLRDFNAGSVQGMAGCAIFIAGVVYGIAKWLASFNSGVVATSGTVMLAALPILVGIQLIISAINYDIANVPKRCLHKLLD